MRNGIRFQVVITDKTDYIIRYETFRPINDIHLEEMMKYVMAGIKDGDVKITRWDVTGRI